MKNKLFLVIMTFLGSLLGACAQDKYRNVDVDEFQQIIQSDSVQLLDVRTPQEFAEGKLANALNIDVMQPNFMQTAMNKLSKNKTIAVYCRSGRRSAHAASMLASKGYKVINLSGGYIKWTSKAKPTVKP